MVSILQKYTAQEIKNIYDGRLLVKVCKQAPAHKVFKVYMYCANLQKECTERRCDLRLCLTSPQKIEWCPVIIAYERRYINLHDLVVGEYVCEHVDMFSAHVVPNGPQLFSEYRKYLGNGVYLTDPLNMFYTVFERNDTRIDTMLKNSDFRKMLSSPSQLLQYAGGLNKRLYGLQIKDVVFYDKPKNLSDFYVNKECEQYQHCYKCPEFCKGRGWLDGSYYEEDSCNNSAVSRIFVPSITWKYVDGVKA